MTAERTPTTVERLAEALYDYDCDKHDMRIEGHSWESDIARQPAYVGMVRAILAELRTPSEGVVPATILPGWRKIIDSILAEGS